jgi:hypothetical protein
MYVTIKRVLKKEMNLIHVFGLNVFFCILFLLDTNALGDKLRGLILIIFWLILLLWVLYNHNFKCVQILLGLFFLFEFFRGCEPH